MIVWCKELNAENRLHRGQKNWDIIQGFWLYMNWDIIQGSWLTTAKCTKSPKDGRKTAFNVLQQSSGWDTASVAHPWETPRRGKILWIIRSFYCQVFQYILAHLNC
jgi:hypothetical protein